MSWFNRVNISNAYAEHIKQEVGISETEIGWVTFMFLVVYAVGMTPGGWFSDRFGTRLSLGLMGIGLGVFAALTGAAGLLFHAAIPLFIALLLIRSPMGLLATPMYPAGSRTIAHWFPFERRASANGFIQGAAALGIAMTPLLFGRLMDRFGWPIAFVIIGAITAAIGLLWLWYARNDPGHHSSVNQAEIHLIQADLAAHPLKPEIDAIDKEPGSWTLLLRNRSLVLLTIGYSAVGYFEYMFNFWTQYYFKDVRNVETDVSRFYAMATNLSMAAGMFLGGGLTDAFVRRFGIRLGRALVPAGGMLLGAAFLLIGLQAEEPIWTVLWICLALAAVGATEAPQWTSAIELGGRRGAMAAGIFNTGGNIGGAFATVITPFVATDLGYGWPIAISLGGIICVWGSTLWLWIDPRERVGDVKQ
jgi:ACS family glucarate transporter-like MFS transporter